MRKKICIVATLPASIDVFLRSHVHAAGKFHDVFVVCDGADRELIEDLPVAHNFIPIERKPSPLKDLHALFLLYRLFQKQKFDIVHTHMPKTGLLGMLAAKLARVRVRLNTFHGEVWASRSGVGRFALKNADRLTAALATHVYAVSHSQREFLVSQRVVSDEKSSVVGAGSICGVNLKRFVFNPEMRAKVRSQLKIPADAKVILYIGRLNRDKGVLELAYAFADLAASKCNLFLLIAGSEEDIKLKEVLSICGDLDKQIRYIPFTRRPQDVMTAGDIICLPSYREGFGLSIIEAAACGIPAVGTRIHGVIDAIQEGKTGLLFAAGDKDGLRSQLEVLIEDDDLRLRLGQCAKERVQLLFDEDRLTQQWTNLYASWSSWRANSG